MTNSSPKLTPKPDEDAPKAAPAAAKPTPVPAAPKPAAKPSMPSFSLPKFDMPEIKARGCSRWLFSLPSATVDGICCRPSMLLPVS